MAMQCKRMRQGALLYLTEAFMAGIDVLLSLLLLLFLRPSPALKKKRKKERIVYFDENEGLRIGIRVHRIDKISRIDMCPPPCSSVQPSLPLSNGTHSNDKSIIACPYIKTRTHLNVLTCDPNHRCSSYSSQPPDCRSHWQRD
jgi:hypothetical protein